MAAGTNTGTSKYDIGARARWRHQGDHPRISDHALQRWDERMPASSISPERAIELSLIERNITEHPKYNHESKPDQLRLYAGFTTTGEFYSAVFVEIEETVVTVYPIGKIDSTPLRAYLQARIALNGINAEGQEVSR